MGLHFGVIEVVLGDVEPYGLLFIGDGFGDFGGDVDWLLLVLGVVGEGGLLLKLFVIVGGGSLASFIFERLVVGLLVCVGVGFPLVIGLGDVVGEFGDFILEVLDFLLDALVCGRGVFSEVEDPSSGLDFGWRGKEGKGTCVGFEILEVGARVGDESLLDGLVEADDEDVLAEVVPGGFGEFGDDLGDEFAGEVHAFQIIF